MIKKLKTTLRKVEPFRKVVVGVSGGADSMALAHALKKLGYEIIIAHLNHQLRGEASNADEQFVKNVAKDWGVLYSIKTGFIPKEGNLENNARKVRYAFLEDVRRKYQADLIAVGHHFDDQVETILMHMVRGTGLRGQVGIKYQKGKLIRPMLDVKRSEVLTYVKENNISYITDESNNDLSFDRNFWRHLAIPYLKKEMPDLYEKIANINEKAGVRLKNVSDKAEKWIDKYIVDNSFKKSAFNRLVDSVKVEILIQMLGSKDLYGSSLNRLVEFIKFGQSGKKLKVKNKTFFVEHDDILITSGELEMPKLPKSKITVKGIKWGKITIKSKHGKPLYVRQWKEGDKFEPKGMKGSKSVQNLFVDKKIPKSKRSQIPIIVDEKDNIMAVGDIRVSKNADELRKDISISN